MEQQRLKTEQTELWGPEVKQMKWSKEDVGTQKLGPGSDVLDSEPKRAS